MRLGQGQVLLETKVTTWIQNHWSIADIQWISMDKNLDYLYVNQNKAFNDN
jgi:hypothetical protein